MTLGMSIKGRFILTLATIVLLSSVCMGVYSYRTQVAQLLHRFEDLGQNETRLFEAILQSDAQGLSRAISGLSRLEAFLPALAAQDRAALLTAARPLFEELKVKHFITHMYFIAPDGTVLLRLHKPEQFGDRLQRATFLRAAETGTTASGLEMGRNFFSLRCVAPVFARGRLLGYLELAEEIDHIFVQMKAITGNDVALFLPRHYIERFPTDLPVGTDTEFATLYPTDRQLLMQAGSRLHGLLHQGLDGYATESLLIGDEHYMVGVGSIRDAFGDTAGVLLSQRRVSHYYAAIWRGVATSLAVFAAILASGNLLLYLSMNKSMQLFQTMRQHIQHVTRTWQLDRPLEVGTSDEIGELAEDFNRMQAEILKLKESLEQQAENLAAANQELESFSYTLSHDLRLPLTRIYSAGQLLREECGKGLDETGLLLVDNICKGCEGMDALIEAILALTQTVRQDLRYETVDLASLAQEIEAELAGSEPERRVTLILPATLLAQGDRQLLRVALKNLLENAWKYTRPVPAAKIELGTAEQHGKKVFFVRDNGVGFDMQQADKLFTPFKRLHDDSAFPGTGIGLATVQKIVQRHGGTIWGVSREGEGATFFFTLKP